MFPESLATWEGQGGDGHPRRQPLAASGLGQEIAAITTTSGIATLCGEILFPEEDSGPLSGLHLAAPERMVENNCSLRETAMLA